jgi:hypothetical protein
MTLADSKKRSKSRHTRSAATLFYAGSECRRYVQPTRAYRDWSFRPDRAAAEDVVTAVKE